MNDFNALYTKYAPDVFRFAMYLSGSRTDAEDITSETFVRAFTSPQPIAAATAKGYLLAIARNLFLKEMRKRSRTVPIDEAVCDQHPGPAAEAETKANIAL